MAAKQPLESTIQREIKAYLEGRGWMVYVTTCGAYQKGLPDLICFRKDVGVRFVDVKRGPKSALTKYQIQLWSQWGAMGLGVYIMTSRDESVLLEEPNWREWWKPSYERYLIRKPSDILRDTS